MALDGIAVHHLAEELSRQLTGGRIQKIYQPESDELLLTIHRNKDRHQLLLSANSNYPRAHLIRQTKENPDAPPMFCMLLRKKLVGGIIESVRQVEFDRILEIIITSRSELYETTSHRLVVEIMGRHSNIILLENDIITDSIKRINKFISSFREVLPGRSYALPPMGKSDFRTLDPSEFAALLTQQGNRSLDKAIMDNIQGISKLAALELAYRSGVDPKQPVGQVPFPILESLHGLLEDLVVVPDFGIYLEKGTIKDFTAFPCRLYEELEKRSYDEISPMLEDFYLGKDTQQRIKQRSAAFHQTIANKLERNYNKFNHLMEDLKTAEDAERYKQYGDILYANLYNLQEKTTHALLHNYYDETMVDIPLDIRYTPAENAKRYYDKYNKQKRALAYIDEQLKKTKEEIYYLESIMDSVDKCSSVEELKEIRDELEETGFIKTTRKKKKKEQSKASLPMTFRSSESFVVLVGKNNKQNDQLTMKTASKEDLWFHVKDIPGSHVIVRTEGKTPGEATVLEAALLAAYFSKGKQSSNVPVDYAQVKHVHKPKGAKPGMVIYTDNKTMYVTPEKSTILAFANVE
ncbi:NFACT family protein [Alkalibacter rhizosphaerae]|uniref:Rqc2 homolog RqcH n=1 Tax=Alkalibacter rhizosphaerae TaxID=2815577 RepID=A0A975AIP8_9FIRM|nr:NFACT RNA binding domain-containing protein [Alkalibacter rhizosphaerae]QSX08755.1 NFACT family protein [Alkalibacter rhizosphaerae]